MQYTVILEPEADGRFSASVPDLPGCTSEGDTYAATACYAAPAITYRSRRHQDKFHRSSPL